MSPQPAAPGDRGSATVWAVLLVALLCAATAGLLALSHALTARHRAGAAADLAALAAADHALEGEATACALAARVASAQGARLLRCAVVGEIADLTAAVGPAQVRSRAGP
jgi:secretion/DNA translocation related TadE-like protein|nr:Rv3654c family TadE-like protein [Actinacidiphila soli]